MSIPSDPPRIEARGTDRSALTRFFGGPPLAVIFRLILLSILIGVILQVLGLDPVNIIDSLRRLLHDLGHFLDQLCGALNRAERGLPLAPMISETGDE